MSDGDVKTILKARKRDTTVNGLRLRETQQRIEAKQHRGYHRASRLRLKMASGTAFEVVYLGSAMLAKSSTGLGALQKPLLELYSHYRTSGTSRIQRKFLEITAEGYTLSYQEGPNGPMVYESYPVGAMQSTEAVRLNIMKGSGKKVKAAFEPLDPETNMNVEKLYTALDKKKNFLAKIVHPSIFVVTLRRAVGVRALDCHAFVCSTAETAIKLTRSVNHIIRMSLNEDDGDTTVFRYNPYDQRNPTDDRPDVRRQPSHDGQSHPNSRHEKSRSLLDQDFFSEPANDNDVTDYHVTHESRNRSLNTGDIWRPVDRQMEPTPRRKSVANEKEEPRNVLRSRSKSRDRGYQREDTQNVRRPQTSYGERGWSNEQVDNQMRDGPLSRSYNYDRRSSSPLANENRPQSSHAPSKPVAKVQPHKIQGIKVLPSPSDLRKSGVGRRSNASDDSDPTTHRYDAREIQQDKRPSSARNSAYESNWQYSTKLPDFSQPSYEDDSHAMQGYQQRGVKDAEIASALKNMRMAHEQERFSNDFESSLGYLP